MLKYFLISISFIDAIIAIIVIPYTIWNWKLALNGVTICWVFGLSGGLYENLNMLLPSSFMVFISPALKGAVSWFP